METIERIYNVKELKAKIKVAAAYQIFLKNQRKTEKLVGKRELPADEASWKHYTNRAELSRMYVAYGVMRGKDLDEQIKAHISKKDDYAAYNAKTKIEAILQEYKLKEAA